MNAFKFDVSQDEANLILASLAKQPFEAVAALINKLQSQAQAQLAEAQAAASDAQAL